MANAPISIPDYFSRFIDSSIDLNKTTKICCPFHEEDTPSFSYSPEKGLWRCFGACKVGGDVVALHQKNYRLRSRREAEESLYKILGLRRAGFSRQVEKGVADECVVAFKSAYAKATMVARTVDDWGELDYIMSQHPPEVDKLEAFYNCRRV